MVDVTYCPTVYLLSTQQGEPVSVSDRVKLRNHAKRLDWKAEAARERMLRVKPWEKSSRNRHPKEVPL